MAIVFEWFFKKLEHQWVIIARDLFISILSIKLLKVTIKHFSNDIIGNLKLFFDLPKAAAVQCAIMKPTIKENSFYESVKDVLQLLNTSNTCAQSIMST